MGSSVDINVNLKPIPQKQITETKSEAKETASAVKVEQVRAETKISATESAQVSAVPKIRVPKAPSSPKIVRTTKETITIKWTEGGPATESYSVEMSENSDSDFKLIK